MRVSVSYRDLTMEYERKPMEEGRFQALCKLAGFGLYVGLVLGIASLCGLLGIAAAAVATIFTALALSI